MLCPADSAQRLSSMSPNPPRPLLDYIRFREAFTESVFLKEHDYPVLVQERAFSADDEESQFSTVYLTTEVKEGRLTSGLMTRPEKAVVYRVMKQNTSLFEGMINVGRAPNNDVVLDTAGVSKFHAYFARNPTTREYYITDANSKNGTFVNRQPLKPHATSGVTDGDRVCFAGQLEFTFYSPPRFFEILGILTR